MGDSVYFVKSIPPRAFSVSEKYLAGMLQVLLDVHEEVKCLKNIFTYLQLFAISQFSINVHIG